MKLALILAVFLASFALVETSRAQSSSSTSSTGTVEAIANAGGSAASNVAGATYAVQTAPPVIFNVSSNAQAGDIISIQGTNFDINADLARRTSRKLSDAISGS